MPNRIVLRQPRAQARNRVNAKKVESAKAVVAAVATDIVANVVKTTCRAARKACPKLLR